MVMKADWRCGCKGRSVSACRAVSTSQLSAWDSSFIERVKIAEPQAVVNLAGAQEFESRPTVLETVMLPLHHTPVILAPSAGLEPVVSCSTHRRSTLEL